MLLTHSVVTKEDNVHPSLIEKATTKSLLKLLKFGTWLEYKKKQNKELDLNEIMSEELIGYKMDFQMRKDTKAFTKNQVFPKIC
jgi:hypothetical protein